MLLMFSNNKFDTTTITKVVTLIQAYIYIHILSPSKVQISASLGKALEYEENFEIIGTPIFNPPVMSSPSV